MVSPTSIVAAHGSDTGTGQTTVRDFLFGLNGSNYYATNATYPGVSGKFEFAVGQNETTDRYSQGSKLSDSKVQSVVSSAIASGKLGPADPNGIHFVLTSSDVAETCGFCSKHCGWHTWSTISGSNIKYSFVGNANRCLRACAAQSIRPNGSAGVDGMVSVIAHELEEANTDPNLNAWYDANGSESADKCAWTFGSNQLLDAKGASYNMTLPAQPNSAVASRNFLIQRELDVTSKCFVDYLHDIQ